MPDRVIERIALSRKLKAIGTVEGSTTKSAGAA